MGMAFGALRGILVVAVLVISLKVFTPVEQDSWWQRSQLVSHFELIGGWFYDHLKNNSPNVSNNINISLDSE